MFSVYDIKAEAYLTPFFMMNDKVAMRAFGDMANNEEHMFNKHPTDYALMEIGVYDEETGKVEQKENHTHLGVAAEYIATQIKKEVMNEV